MAARVKASPLVVATALCVAACGGAVPHPDAADATRASTTWPGTSVADLDAGRTVFIGKCSGCHALPVLDSRTRDEWGPILDGMAERAHLSSGDRDLLTRFVLTKSDRGPAPAR